MGTKTVSLKDIEKRREALRAELTTLETLARYIEMYGVHQVAS